MLGFFSLEGYLLLWGKCIATMYNWEYCILSEDTVIGIRGSYNMCAIGCIPSFFWIIINDGPGNFSSGRSPNSVNHAYLCLYCIVYILYSISTFVLFYSSTILCFLTKYSLYFLPSLQFQLISFSETLWPKKLSLF